MNPRNLLECIELRVEQARAQHTPEQALNIERETRTAFRRYVLDGLGYPRENPLARMTKVEITEADEMLSKMSVRLLPKVEAAMEKSFTRLNVSQAVRNTYGARCKQMLVFCQNEIWYPDNGHKERIRNECSPPRPFQYGPTHTLSLMPGKKKALAYGLKKREISEDQTKELNGLNHFLTASHCSERVIEPIGASTANGYIKEAKLLMGWYARFHNPSMSPEQVSLADLLPVIDEDELEEMSPKQRKQFQRKLKKQLKEQLDAWLTFLVAEAQCQSPRTLRQKLVALLKIAQYQYRHLVEDKADYRLNPAIVVIRSYLEQYDKEVSEWTATHRYVADQSKKWPDVPEGKTALTVVKETLVEPCRLQCRPRQANGQFHKGEPLACSLQIFLMWVDIVLEPARRQQELRTRKIGLACSIKRPDSIPAGGYHHPRPPWELRERKADGTLIDNYLYRTYAVNGKVYPNGVWVKEINAYKTRKFHGKQTIIIRNRWFEDGTCLYDYIERYLYGWWYTGNFRNSITYQWGKPELQYKRGRWLSKGREEFQPICCLASHSKVGDFPWGYLFPVPDVGNAYEDATLAAAFARSSHEWLNKRMTPHTMRYIWATWAYQVGLSDAQLRSLAAAMGCTVETLRKMYERTTPLEKRKLIEEAVDELLFGELDDVQGEASSRQPNHNNVHHVEEALKRLSPAQQQELLRRINPDQNRSAS